MGKNLTEVIEETIEFIKDKRTPQQMASTPNIHIENTESPKFTVWMNCANYIMPDYLWMASEIKNNDGNYRKKHPYLASQPRTSIIWNERDYRDYNKKSSKLREKQEETNIKSKYIADLDDIFSRCKEISVFSAAIENTSKETFNDYKRTEDQRKNQISLFWMIKELQPIAPILTIIALRKGIPPAVQEELDCIYAQLIESQKQSTGVNNKNQAVLTGNDLYSIILELLNGWKKSSVSSAYKRNLDIQGNYWLMICILRLQYELSKEIIYNKGDHIAWKFDLNFNFQLFLSLWPYSPQLFINIEPAENASPTQWNRKLRSFFRRLDLPEKISISDIYLPEHTREERNFLTVEESSFLTFSEYYSLEVQGEGANNWLTPFSPYFAAYYYPEDAWLYGKISGKEGDSYKEEVVLLLLKGEKIPYVRLYAFDELPDPDEEIGEETFRDKKCFEWLRNGKIVDDYRHLISENYDRLFHVLEAADDSKIEREIVRHLSFNYYSLLLGIFFKGKAPLRTWERIKEWIPADVSHEPQDTAAK